MATQTKQEQREALKKEMHAQAEAVAEQIKTNPATAEQFATFSRLFESYSEKNQHLIFAQLPSATRCAGFQQWKKEGRAVMKGQRGIKIFAPTKFTLKDENGKPEKDENGEDKKKDGFIMVTVFDISQTEEVEVTAKAVA